MDEEKKNPGEGEPEDKTPEEIILEMKENTVPKKDYEELEKRHNTLIKKIADGEKIEIEKKTLSEEERTKRIGDLRKSLYSENSNLNNLKFWKNTLELRELLIESGQPDPMVARGKMFDGASEDEQSAEVVKIVDVVNDCIEKANGSSKVFTSLLQDKMRDDPAVSMILLSKKKSRKQ